MKSVDYDLAISNSKLWALELLASNNKYEFDNKFYINLREDQVFYNNLYAFICNDSGHLLFDTCLIFWNKYDLTFTNPGYAHGRFENSVCIKISKLD